MTVQRCGHGILQSHVLPLMQRLSGAFFQQDNAQSHTARVSQDCLHTVTTLLWPARSLDMSPIEHIWDHLGWLEEGQTQAEVAQAIGVSQSVISRIWNRFLETGSAGRRPGQGRRRTTTPNEDRYLVLTAWRHRNMNATLLQQHLRSATGTTV
ncbi:transposable element Tcb2 transposase [Trichonephila clavipes]|nr:transposable element Tcb2 transposase [Trichonephila clavipes]